MKTLPLFVLLCCSLMPLWGQIATSMDYSKIRNGPGISVLAYGALGNGSHDDTTSIQAALNAATGGQVIWFPKGVYKITAALYARAYTTLAGPSTDLQSGQSTTGGAMLKWYGAAPATVFGRGSGMINTYGVNGVRMIGINLDGSNTANLTGWQDDAFVGGTSQFNSYKDALVQHFGNPVTGVAGAGMIFGHDVINVSGEQVDSVDVEGVKMLDVNTGIRIMQSNFAYSKFRRISIAGVNITLDIEYSGDFQFEQFAGGPAQGANPKVIYINGPHGQIIFTNIQAESDTGTGLAAELLDITAGASADPAPLLFNQMRNGVGGYKTFIRADNQNIQFNASALNDLNITGSSNVLSMISTSFAGTTSIGGNNNELLNPTEGIAGSGIPWTLRSRLNNGNPAVQVVQDPASGVVESAVSLLPISGGAWWNIFSATRWGVKDKSNDFYPFTIARGLSGQNFFALKSGYFNAPAFAPNSTVATTLPASTAGIWVETGAGLHIEPVISLFIDTPPPTGTAASGKVLCYITATKSVVLSSSAADCSN